MKAIDPAFWRNLRKGFEGLRGNRFSLLWSAGPQPALEGAPRTIHTDSQWSWWRFPDASLLAQFASLALRGARKLGHDSEDAWYDELRTSHFVHFKRTGLTQDADPNNPDVGRIDDAVKESITLCHRFEAGLKDHSGEPEAPKRPARAKGPGIKPGPKSDYEMAKRIEALVTELAPDGAWRAKWNEIAEALDEEEIPCPKTWTRNDKTCKLWQDQTDKSLFVKAIDYRLKLAARAK